MSSLFTRDARQSGTLRLTSTEAQPPSFYRCKARRLGGRGRLTPHTVSPARDEQRLDIGAACQLRI